MVAPITDYTTFDEVRATLGVNEDELANATLDLPMYALALQAALELIHEELPTDYALINAKDESGRTVAEQRVYNTVRLYAPYQIAVQLSSSLPIFSPKQVSDGKSVMSRYADSPYREAIKNAKAKCDEYSELLARHYASYKGSQEPTRVVYFGVASPVSDPVTG